MNQAIYKGQFSSGRSSSSFQNEAYTRQILRDAKQNRHDLESTLSDIPFIILDTETTGFNPKQGDRIIAISASKTLNGVVLDTYQTLINPERSIPDGISTLTGIESKDTTEAPVLEDIIRHFLSFVSNTVIIGFHIGHDISFMNHFLWQYCRAKLTQQSIELRQIIECLYGESFETLDHALERYDIQCDERHTAKGDVKAMVELWQAILDDLRNRQITTLSELYSFMSQRS